MSSAPSASPRNELETLASLNWIDIVAFYSSSTRLLMGLLTPPAVARLSASI